MLDFYLVQLVFKLYRFLNYYGKLRRTRQTEVKFAGAKNY